MKISPTGAQDQTIPCNRLSRWIRPPNGLIKVNWDASINASQGWVRLGIVARDKNGFVLEPKVLQKSLWLSLSLLRLWGLYVLCTFARK
jgi:hypothetical protein